MLSDTIPTGLTLVNGTIKIDGILQPDTFPISLGTIAVGQTKVVTYSLSAITLPQTNPAINIASIDYEFEPFPSYIVDLKQTSNPVSVFILNENINNVKTVDKTVALQGETLTYTNFITNNGNLNAINFVFTDSIPANTTFVENSVTLDGVNLPGENPENGINIGNINIGQFKTITFKVLVN